MKTKHTSLHPSIDIDKFENSSNVIPDLLNALNDAKDQIFYLRSKLTAKEYKFTTPTSEAVNQDIDKAIKKATK